MPNYTEGKIKNLVIRKHGAEKLTHTIIFLVMRNELSLHRFFLGLFVCLEMCFCRIDCHRGGGAEGVK